MAALSSETSVPFYQTTQHHISEDISRQVTCSVALSQRRTEHKETFVSMREGGTLVVRSLSTDQRGVFDTGRGPDPRGNSVSVCKHVSI